MTNQAKSALMSLKHCFLNEITKTRKEEIKRNKKRK